MDNFEKASRRRNTRYNKRKQESPLINRNLTENIISHECSIVLEHFPHTIESNLNIKSQASMKSKSKANKKKTITKNSNTNILLSSHEPALNGIVTEYSNELHTDIPNTDIVSRSKTLRRGRNRKQATDIENESVIHSKAQSSDETISTLPESLDTDMHDKESKTPHHERTTVDPNLEECSDSQSSPEKNPRGRACKLKRNKDRKIDESHAEDYTSKRTKRGTKVQKEKTVPNDTKIQTQTESSDGCTEYLNSEEEISNKNKKLNDYLTEKSSTLVNGNHNENNIFHECSVVLEHFPETTESNLKLKSKANKKSKSKKAQKKTVGLLENLNANLKLSSHEPSHKGGSTENSDGLEADLSNSDIVLKCEPIKRSRKKRQATVIENETMHSEVENSAQTSNSLQETLDTEMLGSVTVNEIKIPYQLKRIDASPNLDEFSGLQSNPEKKTRGRHKLNRKKDENEDKSYTEDMTSKRSKRGKKICEEKAIEKEIAITQAENKGIDTNIECSTLENKPSSVEKSKVCSELGIGSPNLQYNRTTEVRSDSVNLEHCESNGETNLSDKSIIKNNSEDNTFLNGNSEEKSIPTSIRRDSTFICSDTGNRKEKHVPAPIRRDSTFIRSDTIPSSKEPQRKNYTSTTPGKSIGQRIFQSAMKSKIVKSGKKENPGLTMKKHITQGITSGSIVKKRSTTKMPNFKKIHEKLFKKMESLTDYKKRQLERAENLIQSPQVPRCARPLALTPKPQPSRQLGMFSNVAVIVPRLRTSLCPSPLATKLKSPVANRKTIGAPLPVNRFGFRKVVKKEEAINIIGKKMPRLNLDQKKNNERQILQGVRMNKRFLLQMQMRQKTGEN